MKKKILFSFIIFMTLFLAISAISATEGVTDGDMGILEDNSLSVVSESRMDDSSLSALSLSDGDDYSSNIVQSDEDDDQDENEDSKTEISSNNASITSAQSAKSSTSSSIRTYIKVIDKNVTYHIGSVKEIFQLRLVDGNDNAISGKKLSIRVCGKNYTAKTNSKGYATFYLSNLKKGNKLVKFSFLKSGKYLSCNGSAKIKVKSKLTKDIGYWIKPYDIFKADYEKLSKNGVKHLFIHRSSFTIYGEKKVLDWIRKVHEFDIKVHVWIPTFYSSKGHYFIRPSFKNGDYNKKRMNFLFKKVKHFASLKEIDGIHFDYLRYPFGAYKYKNGVKAINYFVKKATKIISKKNPRIITSAAVMGEPKGMKRHYAQDVPTISKYLDVLVPMVYKGNYRANSKWIKKTTKKFVKLSNGAQIWTGLQSYKSDRKTKKLSNKELRKDAISAKNGGASGIFLFRLGLSKNLDFNDI